jgi:DNA polymerase I-like protein with 3'-5' exonuclease and polymerase domains
MTAVEPTPISTRYLRARSRKLEAVVAAMAEAGVEARAAGADFELVGLESLAAPDRELLERLRPDLERHLAEPGADDPEHLLEVLDIEVELVDDPDQARRVIAGLPDSIGLDIETMPREPGPPPALRLTKSGRRYLEQPPADPTGAALDPFRGQPRLVQAYDPGRETVFIFDMSRLAWGDLAGLFDRQVRVHTMFEPVMLGAQNIELPRLVDTFQLASLALGARDKIRRLDNVAKEILGIELPKELGKSYWAARNLSDQQLTYAAADSVVAWRAGKAMWAGLEARERQAFALANAAVPVISRMGLRGLPFNPKTHAETIVGWQTDYARERKTFRELTGFEVPANAPATRTWLEASLSPEALATWERTPTGLLSTEEAELTRAALEHPEIRPLIAVRKAGKRLETFGQALLDLVVLATGRLHGRYFLPTATGRLSCRQPAIQTFTADVLAAVEAPEGLRLLEGDYNQIEMRIGAERAGESVMQALFAGGEDLHARTAGTVAALAGVRFADLPEDDRVRSRKKAKSTNFGSWYGIGAKSLRKRIWADHELDVSLEEAASIIRAFHETYPAVRPYQQEQYAEGRYGAVWSVAGRPRRACWEPEKRDRRTDEIIKPAGELWFTDCANHGIQASAADVLLDAMVRVDRALPGTLVASVHDALVLLVPEYEAERAAETLAEQMTAAFVRWFPDAPLKGLVSVKTVKKWSEAK